MDIHFGTILGPYSISVKLWFFLLVNLYAAASSTSLLSTGMRTPVRCSAKGAYGTHTASNQHHVKNLTNVVRTFGSLRPEKIRKNYQLRRGVVLHHGSGSADHKSTKLMFSEEQIDKTMSSPLDLITAILFKEGFVKMVHVRCVPLSPRHGASSGCGW
jgi:hypothetical protein